MTVDKKKETKSAKETDGKAEGAKVAMENKTDLNVKSEPISGSESEISKSNNTGQNEVRLKEKPVAPAQEKPGNREQKSTMNIKPQKLVKDIRVVNLTKKIFASFPIKHEPCDSEENAELAKISDTKKIKESCKNDEETDVLMYISEDETLYHAVQIDHHSEDLDKKSLYTLNGMAYYIRPVSDEELCDLVIEYLELIKEYPKGLFSIDISGNFGRKETEECTLDSSQTSGEQTTVSTGNQEGQNTVSTENQGGQNTGSAKNQGDQNTGSAKNQGDQNTVAAKNQGDQNTCSTKASGEQTSEKGETTSSKKASATQITLTKEPTKEVTKVKVEVKEKDKQDEYAYRDDDEEEIASVRVQPKRGAKLIKPVSDVLQICSANNKNEAEDQKRRKQDLKNLYEFTEMPRITIPKLKSGSQTTLSMNNYRKPEKTAPVIPKVVKGWKRRNGRLRIDNKTEFPIFEMKMNMQVTHDTVNHTPQVATVPKKAKLTDSLMQSPGKNIQSDKLLEIYNSRLVTNCESDSDDELKDLGLQEVSQITDKAHVFTGWKTKMEPVEPVEEKGWKICYL